MPLRLSHPCQFDEVNVHGGTFLCLVDGKSIQAIMSALEVGLQDTQPSATEIIPHVGTSNITQLPNVTETSKSDIPYPHIPPVYPPLEPKSNTSVGWKAFSTSERYVFIGVFSVVLICGLIGCCRCLSICIDSPTRNSRRRRRLRLEDGVSYPYLERRTLNSGVQRPDMTERSANRAIADSPPPYEQPPDYSLSLSLGNNKNQEKTVGSPSQETTDRPVDKELRTE